MHSFGQFILSWFVERRFALDGGTMFGVVPRVIWGKLMPVDENNCVPMVTRLYVLEAGGKRYLVDTGLGDCLSEREQKVYVTGNDSGLDSGLAALGLTPSDIDVVLLTHLHTDHSGGAMKVDHGQFVPRFPNATYVVQRIELEAALNPDERSAAAYSQERMGALEASGQLTVIDGDTELAPGVRAVVTGGHTAGHQGFEFTSGGETVANYCDIVPFAHHLRIPYIAATDLFPLETLRLKQRLIPRLVEERITLALAHDFAHTLVCLAEERGRVTFTDVQPAVTGA
ncbi:MAG TPA: MBL fold metallo-hydrolase [candidate division Zixibacteria bacterium]|nr:MBL fold metallo-hydrolase [candidate division Zixibacteria bacterium]